MHQFITFTNLPMLDGYAAAIVAGPVSTSPLDWICPLLAIDADAFNHGGTPEFGAVSAVALGHNEISQTLSTTPGQFAPMHQRKINGDVDPRPWCQGFYGAIRLRLSAWAPLLDTSNVNHSLLLSILLHCRNDQGQPLLGPPQSGREPPRAYATFCRPSRPSASTDADPLRAPPLMTANVRAHTGYERASAGSDGISRGCTTLSACSTAIACDATDRKLLRSDRSPKPWSEANGSAQCGKSARCVHVAGLETWRG
jgi:uncharacterized protein